MATRPLRLAIAGAGGFLGTAATRYFLARAEVAEVRALYTSPAAATAARGERAVSPRFQAFVGELQDRVAVDHWLSGADAVLHVAGRGRALDGEINAARMIDENLSSTAVLLEAMAQRGVARLVYASSGGALYQPARDATPYTEAAPTEARTPYALVKMLIEQLIAFHGARWGLRTAVLRLSNPFGAGQYVRGPQGFIATAIQRALTNRPFPVWSPFTTVKDFIYIDDVLSAFAAVLIRAPQLSGTFNLGLGAGTSLAEVLRIVEGTTGLALALEPGQTRPGDAPWTVLDTSELQAMTGWRCQRSVADGITAMWRELQQQQVEAVPQPEAPGDGLRFAV